MNRGPLVDELKIPEDLLEEWSELLSDPDALEGYTLGVEPEDEDRQMFISFLIQNYGYEDTLDLFESVRDEILILKDNKYIVGIAEDIELLDELTTYSSIPEDLKDVSEITSSIYEELKQKNSNHLNSFSEKVQKLPKQKLQDKYGKQLESIENKDRKIHVKTSPRKEEILQGLRAFSRPIKSSHELRERLLFRNLSRIISAIWKSSKDYSLISLTSGNRTYWKDEEFVYVSKDSTLGNILCKFKVIKASMSPIYRKILSRKMRFLRKRYKILVFAQV